MSPSGGVVGSPPLDPAQSTEAHQALWSEYRSYCDRQAARLLRLIPREAIRPLYRAAREWAAQDDATDVLYRDDPMATLVAFCQGLMPLPPFAVWLEDRDRHPADHLADRDEAPDPPTAAAPSTLDARDFRHGGMSWVARLESFRDHGAWRAFISFTEVGRPITHRTGVVFREEDPEALRERFHTFESTTLSAFLRSALP
ncbi:MAG: hypothetical protein OEZ65_06930 [Gemmatimonadota bacterium]|nr:hypothetical protein [Gemmatimonadota bacterium]MDH5759306.1 hypothetical protein [Gemmatimonadota bacterium]